MEEKKFPHNFQNRC